MESSIHQDKINVKLLGIGSAKDKTLKANLMQALHKLGLEVEIEEIFGIEELLKYQISPKC